MTKCFASITSGAIIIYVLGFATEIIVDQDNENGLWLSPLTNVNHLPVYNQYTWQVLIVHCIQ